MRPDRDARCRLLAAATDLFVRKGFAGTSVQEIVAAAGVTKPVLYYHFRSKAGIFLEMTREGASEFLGIVARHECGRGSPVLPRIVGLCREVFELLVARIDVVRVLYGIYYGPTQGAPAIDVELFHERFHAVLGGLVDEGLARGELRDLDRETIILAVAGALSACIETVICHPGRPMDAQTLARVLDAVCRGIAAAPQEDSQ